MTISKDYRVSLAAICAAAFLLASPMLAHAQSVTIGATDIGGMVSGPNGPEAGVWVIAETTDLPTKYAKIVVTDDRGRYLIPSCRGRGTRCGCAATGWSTPRRSKATPAGPST